jgi:hypothetical protein
VKLVAETAVVKKLKAKYTWRANRVVGAFAGYSLAARRSIAHASQRSTVAMITHGMEGEVYDHHTVGRWEHRLAAAKTVRSLCNYAGVKPDLAIFEVHGYRADATHQDAVERSKVHVGEITSSSLTREALEQYVAGPGGGSVDADLWATLWIRRAPMGICSRSSWARVLGRMR